MAQAVAGVILQATQLASQIADSGLDVKDVVPFVTVAIGASVTAYLSLVGGLLALWKANHDLDVRLSDRMDREDQAVAQKRDALASHIWDCIDHELRPAIRDMGQQVAVLEATRAGRGEVVDQHATTLLPPQYERPRHALEALENMGAESLPTRDLDSVRQAAENVINDPESSPSDRASALQLLARVKSTLIVREQVYGGAPTPTAMPAYRDGRGG